MAESNKRKIETPVQDAPSETRSTKRPRTSNPTKPHKGSQTSQNTFSANSSAEYYLPIADNKNKALPSPPKQTNQDKKSTLRVRSTSKSVADKPNNKDVTCKSSSRKKQKEPLKLQSDRPNKCTTTPSKPVQKQSEDFKATASYRQPIQVGSNPRTFESDNGILHSGCIQPIETPYATPLRSTYGPEHHDNMAETRGPSPALRRDRMNDIIQNYEDETDIEDLGDDERDETVLGARILMAMQNRGQHMSLGRTMPSFLEHYCTDEAGHM